MLFVLLFFFSCNRKNDSKYIIDKNENGTIKSITIYQGSSYQVFEFNQLGQCSDILKFQDSLLTGEQLYFTDGNLTEKVNYDSGKANGHFYMFFSKTGAVKQHRYLVKGLEHGLGIDYYDMEVEITKSSLYFNDSGKIFYTQNFDSTGHFVSEEGVVPVSVQEYRKLQNTNNR